MIVVDVEQGSRAWEETRMGIPTASSAARIVTPSGKLSTQRKRYMAELVCEWVLREPFTDFVSDDMQRGKALGARRPRVVRHADRPEGQGGRVRLQG